MVSVRDAGNAHVAERGMLELIIHSREYSSPADGDVEVVERKGIGHPDTICDGLAEEIGRALCRAYLDIFGAIAHYNVDKILLCGGAAQPAFGGGEILDPIEFYLGGRVTMELGGRRIPAAEIAVETCRGCLKTQFPDIDWERHAKIFPRFRPGSGELRSLFSKGKRVALSNDSSCGAGFAPLTPLERITLEVEQTLNSADTKRTYPAIGRDVKVLGVRKGSRIDLTISCAMIGRHLRGIGDYMDAKAVARKLALDAARRMTGYEVDAVVNVADDFERGELFLTVTGTSAESGDDGQVGRGNRVSGLITPYRPMTMEAAAGKNPVSHVGKLYSLVASEIANRIAGSAEVSAATCLMVSQIGRPVDDPQLVDVWLQPGTDSEKGRELARDIVLDELQRFDELEADLIAGRKTLY